jgi:hypothetical protein
VCGQTERRFLLVPFKTRTNDEEEPTSRDLSTISPDLLATWMLRDAARYELQDQGIDTEDPQVVEMLWKIQAPKSTQN